MSYITYPLRDAVKVFGALCFVVTSLSGLLLIALITHEIINSSQPLLTLIILSVTLRTHPAIMVNTTEWNPEHKTYVDPNTTAWRNVSRVTQ